MVSAVAGRADTFSLFPLSPFLLFGPRSTMKLNRKYINPYILTRKNTIGLFDRIFILGEKTIWKDLTNTLSAKNKKEKTIIVIVRKSKDTHK
jgi:hypothetical protein